MTSTTLATTPSTRPSPSGLSVLVKGVLIGDFAVGKSSLFQRYLFDNSEYTPTIGVDFYSCRHVTSHGHRVRLQLWDTAGQERFRSIIASYVRNVYLVYLVFDVTRKSSFVHLSNWITFVHANNGPTCQFVLVANKVDCPRANWSVTEVDIDAFVVEHGVQSVYYVSALHTIDLSKKGSSPHVGASQEDLRTEPEDISYEALSHNGSCAAPEYFSSSSIRTMFENSLTSLLQNLGDGTALDPLTHLASMAQPDRRMMVACSDACLTNGEKMVRYEPPGVTPTADVCLGGAPGATPDNLCTPPGSPTSGIAVHTSAAPYVLQHTSTSLPLPLRHRHTVCSCTTHPRKDRCSDSGEPSLNCGSVFSLSSRLPYARQNKNSHEEASYRSREKQSRWASSRCDYC